MNLDIIDAFLKVAEKGSLSKAAAEINISQSALSKQMIYLEEYLNKSLLHRSFKGISLTPDGEIVIRHFTKIKEELQRLNDSLNENHPPIIGATPTIGMKIHQCAFEEQIVHNILLLENIEQLINLYQSGKIDVLFLADTEYVQTHYTDILKNSFTFRVATHILVHKSSPLCQQSIVTISDICKNTCIFYNGEQLMFQHLNTGHLLSILSNNTLSDKYLLEISHFIAKNPNYYSFCFVNHNTICSDVKAIELSDVPIRYLTVTMHNSKYKKELLTLKEYFH